MNLLFLDLETTGLDPEINSIVEVAAILLLGEDDAEEVLVDALVWDHTERPTWDNVIDMHRKSGLRAAWDRVVKVHLADAEETILNRIEQFDPRSVVLAGNSPHAVDRPFLQRHMPRLDAALHYRHMDVSCLMGFFEEYAVVPRVQEKAHRAMADVKSSLATYRRLADMLSDWAFL
jgi:oligoribonuclease